MDYPVLLFSGDSRIGENRIDAMTHYYNNIVISKSHLSAERKNLCTQCFMTQSVAWT